MPSWGLKKTALERQNSSPRRPWMPSDTPLDSKSEKSIPFWSLFGPFFLYFGYGMLYFGYGILYFGYEVLLSLGTTRATRANLITRSM